MKNDKEFIQYDIDKIKNISILDVLSRYGIKTDGRKLINCPLPGHEDNTPSFQLFTDSNKFTCYGCGERGDVIDLVQLIEKFSGPDGFQLACKLLSDNEGFTQIERTPSPPPPKMNNQDREIYQAFCNLLELTTEGVEYLAARGMYPSTLKHHNIKNIENPRKIAEKLQKQFSMNDLLHSGLFGEGLNNTYFVFYKPCIIFPFIRDGKPIYFSSRNYDSNPKSFKLAKVNHRYFIGDMAAGELIIFEGILDALSYWQMTGQTNFIAINGLMSVKHYETLIQYTGLSKIILAMDNDEPGKNTIKRLQKEFIINSLIWDSVCKTYQVDPSDVKDWNDLLLATAKACNYWDNGERIAI